MPEYDALIEKARVTFDAKERYKIYNQAEAVMLKESARLPHGHAQDGGGGVAQGQGRDPDAFPLAEFQHR